MAAVDVSVVLPTYRRGDLLNRCLEALANQSLAADRYEIIVADDGPEEATRRRVVAFAKAHPLHAVHYIPVRRTQGPAGARNEGWKSATSTLIAFTDDDTIPDPGWLEAGLRGMGPYDAAAGRIVMPLPAVPTDYEKDSSGLSRAEFATANCFVRRAALEQVGGFDERYTMAWREDSDLQFALLSNGLRVGAINDAVVVHPVRPGRFGISLSQQRKVMFDMLLARKHPVLYRDRIKRHWPWRYLVTTGAFAFAIVLLAAGYEGLSGAALLVWTALSIAFAARRLSGTSRSPAHLVEMLLTSFAIPPLSLFWRFVGWVRFHLRAS